MSQFHLLSFEGLSIYEQLQIEEALIRADDRNWIIVNHGSMPAIVMGISGKHAQLINSLQVKQKPIPIIRRFSGGGTVVVDQQTQFYTLIGNRADLDFPCYPEALMQWTEKLYKPAFEGVHFSLRAQDYTIGDKKFGGNAQYITKGRWLHHSSLLWDYDEDLMEYLLIPPKMPDYRESRCHSTFLCRLRDYFSSQKVFHSKVMGAFAKHMNIIPGCLTAIQHLFEQPYRRSTRLELFGHCFNFVRDYSGCNAPSATSSSSAIAKAMPSSLAAASGALQPE